MDFTDFDNAVEKLGFALKYLLNANKSYYKTGIWRSYIDCYWEIKSIIERIEEETQKFMALRKELLNTIDRKEKPNDELLSKIGKNLTLTRLDIKSFYIFIRIFLDTLVGIINLFFGKKGEQLTKSMTSLLKRKKFKKIWMKLDYDFFKGLSDKMLWYDDFVKKRDDIVHNLGSIRGIWTDISFGFDILSDTEQRQRSWGTDTVKPIIPYIENALKHLSEVILYIHNHKSRSFS